MQTQGCIEEAKKTPHAQQEEVTRAMRGSVNTACEERLDALGFSRQKMGMREDMTAVLPVGKKGCHKEDTEQLCPTEEE